MDSSIEEEVLQPSYHHVSLSFDSPYQNRDAAAARISDMGYQVGGQVVHTVVVNLFRVTAAEVRAVVARIGLPLVRTAQVFPWELSAAIVNAVDDIRNMGVAQYEAAEVGGTIVFASAPANSDLRFPGAAFALQWFGATAMGSKPDMIQAMTQVGAVKYISRMTIRRGEHGAAFDLIIHADRQPPFVLPITNLFLEWQLPNDN